MELTLDNYLAEIDRWKRIVTDRVADLSTEDRAKEEREAIAWLEMKLGRSLKKAEAPEAIASTTSK